MLRMIIFGTGMGIGYTLGARAGQESYDRIKSLAVRTKESAATDRMLHRTADRAGLLFDDVAREPGTDGSSGWAEHQDVPGAERHQGSAGPGRSGGPGQDLAEANGAPASGRSVQQ